MPSRFLVHFSTAYVWQKCLERQRQKCYTHIRRNTLNIWPCCGVSGWYILIQWWVEYMHNNFGLSHIQPDCCSIITHLDDSILFYLNLDSHLLILVLVQTCTLPFKHLRSVGYFWKKWILLYRKDTFSWSKVTVKCFILLKKLICFNRTLKRTPFIWSKNHEKHPFCFLFFFTN